MSDKNLIISLVQYNPHWEDVTCNLTVLGRMIQPLAGKTNLIVLPEMFPTGFSMNAGYANTGNQNTVLLWMQKQAVSTGAMVTGSMAISEHGNHYNRFYWVSPDGKTGYYDKFHLFTMSGEPQYFTAGTEQKRFGWMGWEVKPIVCYDLRFPAWCRNTCIKPYDLLICPASWPAVRSDVWITLLKARALENQCYVAGVNRVGADGNGLAHKGDSVVYGPKGETIGRLAENEETAASFNLSLAALHDFRTKFPVLDDMDEISMKETG